MRIIIIIIILTIQLEMLDVVQISWINIK